MLMDDLFTKINDGDLFEDVPEGIEILEPVDPTSTEPVSFEYENEEYKEDLFGDVQDKKPESEMTALDYFLQSKGITDSKIKTIGEDNQEQEVDFYSLSAQDQFDVLSSLESYASDDLVEDEVQLLNHIRSNNLTVDEFLAYYKDSILQEAGLINEPDYEIDSYDDNELFLLDLHQKFELTEEELAKELEKELQDPDLFKKKVDKLRDEYKQLEDQHKQATQEALAKDQQEQYNSFVQTMYSVASNTPDLYGLELEEQEKHEVLSFLLNLDKDGVSGFYKSLNDPQKLYEAAWFLRYGKDSFDVIKGAYEAEIARLKKDNKPIVDIRGRK